MVVSGMYILTLPFSIFMSPGNFPNQLNLFPNNQNISPATKMIHPKTIKYFPKVCIL